MKIPYSSVRRDFLALRGESPDLLPVLDDDEQSAVLTLDAFLRAAIPSAAIEATLRADPLSLDEIAVFNGKISWSSRWGYIEMPADYLKFHYLKLPEWEAGVSSPEPSSSLRFKLGPRLPLWMACDHNPMVVEERTPAGIRLKICGSSRQSVAPESLLYIPLPKLEEEILTISGSAYALMMAALSGLNPLPPDCVAPR